MPFKIPAWVAEPLLGEVVTGAYRVAAVEGRFTVTSDPGEGTHIRAEIPLAAETAAAVPGRAPVGQSPKTYRPARMSKSDI